MTDADGSFLDSFFAQPNIVWPNRAPDHESAAFLEQFVRTIAEKRDIPLIVPRKESDWPESIVYVICWSRGHAGRVRPLLEHWVGGNWAPFDGRLTSLRVNDSLEKAIIDFVGHGTTYVLRPSPRTHGSLFKALRGMVAALEQRPPRTLHLPRPIGRLLRDFETSLAAGQAETSQDILNEIEQSGGVSHENVAFLRLRRLGRLGADNELLGSPLLQAIVAADPPRLVREVVLGAWYRSVADSDLDRLIGLIKVFTVDIGLLADVRLATTSDVDAWATGAVVAVARGDASLATVLLESSLDVPTFLREALVGLVARHVPPAVLQEKPPAVPSEPQESDVPPPTIVDVAPPKPSSWVGWLTTLGTAHAAALDDDLIATWQAPGEIDEQLARAISELPDAATDALFDGVGALIDADDADEPAWRTAAELIGRYLLSDNFSPSDLGAMSALTGAFLRGAPPTALYEQVLQDLVNFKDRWSSIATAASAIDIADLVVTSPSSSGDIQRSFVASAMANLNALRHRLPDSLRAVAELATNDLHLAWDWSLPSVQDAEDVAPVAEVPRVVLVYSLDDGVLARARTALAKLHPTATVHTSNAKVGSDALRTHTRNADLIVLATRRATHAATQFIQANVGGGKVVFADGCGSGSMMRAIEDGLLAISA